MASLDSRPMKIVPSVLTADFARLGEVVAELDRAGVDRIHWDVMDGVYVPNLTFGPDVIAACRGYARCGFEVHLMCERPEELFPRYVEAGCELLLVHPETLRQPHQAYRSIVELGARAGVAISPASPLTHLDHVLDVIDMVTVMTVNPGFGGQSYLASMEPKIAAARARLDAVDRPIELEVDGGVGPDTIARAAGCGADVFITGSALWRYDSFAEGVRDLRQRVASQPGAPRAPGPGWP
jgi:ribulose-phosphate 3-epimerase